MQSPMSQYLRCSGLVLFLVLVTQAVAAAKNPKTNTPPGGCDLYPIALSLSSVSNISTGTVLSNLRNGADRNDFGWLSWTGNQSHEALAQSLSAGDSETYVNPFNRKDKDLTVLDGMDLERDWGTKRFLTYYFVCGVGAGLCDVIANVVTGNLGTRTIGASGAIYGLLLAFGMLYPDRTVLMSFLFPIKAKYFVMIMGAIAFLSSIGSSGSRVSNVAHLGGMLFGYLYLRMKMPSVNTRNLMDRYQTWKLQRARKRFQVYMRKHKSDRDPWVR